ncbi:MAG: helix-turn-helix transcriptional regulator [Pirellulales bacterium]|nr:helix-turn-helix transcriptional regulator [Pirellulales bacterium]
MLAPYQIDRVRKLLAEGKLSPREIARQTGVSRGAIAKIAAGKPLDPPSPRANRLEGGFDEPLLPPERCPACGRLIYPPCRACLTPPIPRWRRPKPGPRTKIVLGLALKPRHFDRYREVRNQRREKS